MIAALALAALVGARSGEAAAGAEPRRAEYAVRWNPQEGGPATAAEVLAFLEAPPSKGEVFEVRYFDLPKPAGAPAGADTVLRRRSGGDAGPEIRLKFRLARPLAGRWGCPTTEAFRRSEEVDIGFGGADAPSRVYSYSCTLAAEEPPRELGAAAKRCASRMTRWQIGATRAEAYRVEEWRLPGGDVRLEISRAAANDVDELARFAGLVTRLRTLGARPLDESKTELGSRCPRP